MRKLYWPWALPYFFAGLKVGVSVATIGAVIGEWVGAQQGLGYLMIQANARLKVDLVFAAILWLSLMGVGLWVLVGDHREALSLVEICVAICDHPQMRPSVVDFYGEGFFSLGDRSWTSGPHNLTGYKH